MKPKALYAGTFNPFTLGHFDIVNKAVKIFDLFILVADNSDKIGLPSAEKRCQFIKDVLKRKNIEANVVVLDGLVADFAKAYQIYYAIRGLRSVTDYNYEEELANYNKMINSELETIYFRADSNISSSFVRELIKYNKNTSAFLP